MNELLPIIRRQRRPVLGSDVVPVPPVAVAAEATTEKPLPPVVTPEKTKTNDAPIPTNRTAR